MINRGPHKQRYHQKSWPYLENLGAAGYQPEDIQYVLCTHLHADHVGWNTRLVGGRWIPVFPNARYLFAAKELEYWQDEGQRGNYTDDPYFEDSTAPILESGLADLVAMNHVIDEFVALEPSVGHTPGHVSVWIRSDGEEAVLSGDIMHTALQCAEPELNSCFCIDAEMSRRTRRQFVERHADSNIVGQVGHIMLRSAVMGMSMRQPDGRELATMQDLLAKCLKEGASGLSFGLMYNPSSYAEQGEIRA